MLTLGYTIFTVADVARTLTFFEEAFDMSTRLLTPECDYGELETGPTTLAFVVEELAHENLDAAGGFTELDAAKPPVAASITLLTDDPREAVERAIAAGARPYVEPIDKPWGQTVAYVRDPNGILIELATPIPA